MGKHVDTTRTVDQPTGRHRYFKGLPVQAHRKPGEAISRAGFAASQVEGYRQAQAARSGNPDTDKAWAKWIHSQARPNRHSCITTHQIRSEPNNVPTHRR